jgi:membrane protein implicated in regulation of membrane protease activity
MWLILAALLLTAEVFVPGFVLAGLSAAAVAAAAVHYFTNDLGWALAAYCAAALVFFAGIRPFALRTFMGNQPSPFGVNAMLGQRITVIGDGAGDGHLYTIFRDSRWSVTSDDALAAGDAAEIVGVSSSTLVVRRITT